MAWLKNLPSRVGEQLRHLSLSQRLVIVLSGVLVAGSLLWLVQWAASPEMTPLLTQPLTADELTRVRNGLDTINQSYEVRDSRIFVPVSANQTSLIAQLNQSDQLPDSTSISFEALVKENNPWLSAEENNRRWTVALANKLEEVLRKFAGVRDAEVFLDLNDRPRRLMRNNAESSASVTLFMKGGESVNRSLALAAARLVSGAVRGVTLRQVSVVDGGNNQNALEWDDEAEGGAAATLHKQKREQERVLAEKIRGQLGDPKVRVSVQVELDMTATSTESHTPVEGVPTLEERDSSERSRGMTAGQPGVQPNVGVAAGAGGNASTETRTTSTTQFQPGGLLETKQTPSGGLKEVFAAINISHSYLESVFRRQSGADAPAKAEDIVATFEAEKARIISQVSKLVKPPSPEQVAVDWYYDTVAADLAPDRGLDAGSAAGSTMDLMRRYGPQSALGMLALVSFALMLNMARKVDATGAIGMEIGLPKEAIEAARQAARDANTAVSTRAAQPDAEEAAPLSATRAADGLLVGRELDEASVQTQNMIEQVAAMVEKDPEAIAGLLEQWVRSTG